MKLDKLFDFDSYEHKQLFSEAKQLWDPIKNLSFYLESILAGQKKEVLVGEGSSIDPQAKIEGPVIIGKNTQIKEGVLLREGIIIGDNCNIGHGCEVKHSIILNNTNTAHFNYVGDSILGNNVNFAAGAITANYKHGAKNEIVNLAIQDQKTPTGLRKFGALLGDGAKIGCNVVLDPGTIIGKHSLVYPLVAVRGTIPENKILKNKQPLELVDKQ